MNIDRTGKEIANKVKSYFQIAEEMSKVISVMWDVSSEYRAGYEKKADEIESSLKIEFSAIEKMSGGRANELIEIFAEGGKGAVWDALSA